MNEMLVVCDACILAIAVLCWVLRSDRWVLKAASCTVPASLDAARSLRSFSLEESATCSCWRRSSFSARRPSLSARTL